MKLLGWLDSVWKWIGRNRITVVSVALLAVLFWALWVYRDGVLSCWEWFACVPDGKESRSTTARNVGLLLFGVVAIAFAVWRGVVASRQAETSQRGLLNERYQKGAEMLGSDLLAVRLGGIYALQRLAEENAGQYQIQIMRLLCAFVRHPTDENNNATGTEGQPDNKDYPVREDVHAAMKAIGTRSSVGIELEQEEGFHLDLSGADLIRADLNGAQLGEADLTRAELTRADLIRADLNGAQLGEAILTRAELTRADLTRAHLSGADLTRAHLTGAELTDAHMPGAHLTDAHLIGTHLNGADLREADLTRADLTRAHLTGAHLSSADLRAANLKIADMTRAYLISADMTDADMTHADMTRADMTRADMTRADLTGADLTGADLTGADLTRAGLIRADLIRADLTDVDLAGADLTDANLTSATLSKAKGLTQQQLDRAVAVPTSPPELGGLRDAKTGELLEWRGKEPDVDR